MNTRDLQYFIELVKLKNYSQVAREFSVSQPTITQSVQRLEREFQTTLVNPDRTHREDMITRSGLLLYENAQLLLNQLAVTRQTIERDKLKQIQIGIPPLIGRQLMPVLVRDLDNQILKRLKIIAKGSHDLLREVKQGKLDISLIASLEPIQVAGLDVQQITATSFKLIVSESHPLANREAVSFSELADEKFITYDQQYIHQKAFQTYCKYTGIAPDVAVYRMPDVSWVKELVRQNEGVALMIEPAVRNEPGIKVLTLTDQVPIQFEISLVTQHKYVLSDDEQQVVDVMERLVF